MCKDRSIKLIKTLEELKITIEKNIRMDKFLRIFQKICIVVNYIAIIKAFQDNNLFAVAMGTICIVSLSYNACETKHCTRLDKQFLEENDKFIKKIKEEMNNN